MIIILGILFFLYLGDFRFNNWHMSLPKWRISVAYILLGVSVSLFQEQGRVEGTKEICKKK